MELFSVLVVVGGGVQQQQQQQQTCCFKIITLTGVFCTYGKTI